jgi:hypothetical protein
MSTEYPGHWPSAVAKDAKYHMTFDGQVKLVYRESKYQERHVLITGHRHLAAMVNRVKVAGTGQPGGVFYLNEYSHVVVPVGREVIFMFGGTYRDKLEFPYEGTQLSPVPPRHLRPGDEWPGPHVGIPYTLCAGGDDIKYRSKIPGHRLGFTWEFLSDAISPSYAERLARRLGDVKGWSGGRIYINEARALFAPVEIRGKFRHLYLGLLDDDPWFPEPKVGDVA